MWHSLCAVILMSSVTLAESERLASQSNTDLPTTKPVPAQTKPPGYRQYTYYTEIRQGTTERAAVTLAIGAFVTSPRSAVPGIVSLKLELQGAEGITVKKVDYPKPRQQKFAFRPGRYRSLLPITGRSSSKCARIARHRWDCTPCRAS
jgi:hypothetical protein